MDFERELDLRKSYMDFTLNMFNEALKYSNINSVATQVLYQKYIQAKNWYERLLEEEHESEY